MLADGYSLEVTCAHHIILIIESSMLLSFLITDIQVLMNSDVWARAGPKARASARLKRALAQSVIGPSLSPYWRLSSGRGFWHAEKMPGSEDEWTRYMERQCPLISVLCHCARHTTVEDATATAALGGAYNVVGLKDGGSEDVDMGHGDDSRRSGA